MIRIINSGVPTATSLEVTYEIIEKLCKKYCVFDPTQPIMTNTFTIADTYLVGTTLYAKCQVVSQVAYKPKSGCACSLANNTFVENFTISFPGAGSTSTIVVSATAGEVNPSYVCERNCSMAQGVSSTGVATFTFTA